MSEPPNASSLPLRVYGLDFSGSLRAGEKIWLAGGIFDGDRLRVDRCLRGAELPDSAVERERCLAALRVFIAGCGQPVPAGLDRATALGCDFPFALPVALMGDNGWESYVRGLTDRYTDAESFRNACVAASGGSELRRRCDVESRTPFSAYNLRLYRQTYAGIGGLLAPLLQADAIRVLPMQPPVTGKPWLLEVCPASTLKRLGWYLRGYKGKGERPHEARRRILAALEETGRLALACELRGPVLDDAEGDALDSVIAAVATAEALREPARHVAATDPVYAVEGYVYA